MDSGLTVTCRVSTVNSTEYTVNELTLDGDIDAFDDKAATLVGALGGNKTFKDVVVWIGGKALGGSSFSVDMGI